DLHQDEFTHLARVEFIELGEPGALLLRQDILRIVKSLLGRLHDARGSTANCIQILRILKMGMKGLYECEPLGILISSEVRIYRPFFPTRRWLFVFPPRRS